MLRIIKMPVKEVPVPTGEEVVDAQEPQERQPEEVFAEELPELVPEAKPVKKEESWTKAVPKRKAKPKKEEEKVDLKQEYRDFDFESAWKGFKYPEKQDDLEENIDD